MSRASGSTGHSAGPYADPTDTGNVRNGYRLTGALPNAPISGAWFSARFQGLMKNAYPPLS